MKKPFIYILCAFLSIPSFAQYRSSLPEKGWVDSVVHSLSKDEKIAQLIIIRAHSNLGAEHVQGVINLITKYKVGALCFFQGGPVRQALLTNRYQALAKTPLLITIDGEWGLGMRLDSIIKYPFQLTLGALPDEHLVYGMGLAIGQQMKRMGVQVNFAPVMDINNNPANPVIGYRSFGEEREKVARMGLAYIRGMQEAGIMACVKHFPGHGDTDVDSHADLPVISKSMEQLDSLELYPFKQAIKGGVGSVMIGHLSIPAIDNTANQPTSLSKKAITNLLHDDLNFDGLTFTDALEMKGVTKYYPAGAAAVQALIAGNDMLCLPEDVTAAIDAIKTAIKRKKLRWKDIDSKLHKVLTAKYRLGLNHPQVIDTTNLLADLNNGTEALKKAVARNTVTVLHNETNFFPFAPNKRIAYVGIGAAGTIFGQRLAQDFKADTFSFSHADDTAKRTAILYQIDSANYDAVIIGVHNYSNRPANNYGIDSAAMPLWDSLQKRHTATFLFGNIYAAKNFCTAKTLVALHQDDAAFQEAAADFLRGSLTAIGRAPVSVCDVKYGSGIVLTNLMPVGFAASWLKIDSIVQDGLQKKAYPGAVVIAVHDGVIKYHKAFGHFEFDPASRPVTLESIYDLASVTKTSATTLAVMKLYEQGGLDLDKTLGDYLPFAIGTNKAPLKIRDVLLHQAGLSPYISFYTETINKTTGEPSPVYYSSTMDTLFSIPVARNVWLRRDWADSMLLRIMQSPLTAHGKYVYSDNDFILLGKIVERLTGTPLDQYVQKTFYAPMGLATTGFRAALRFGAERIVPTELDNYFRKQLLQGYVHDEGAAMFGNVSGHAGLFSSAYDLALLYQMLLNGGVLNGERYLKPETIALFSAYNSNSSRRGLGFDKPERDNATRSDPYPSAMASLETFGHTGFTGTCVWVDPKAKLVYIFLSNRVYNTRANNLLSQMGIRGKIQDAIYEAIKKEAEPEQTMAAKKF